MSTCPGVEAKYGSLMRTVRLLCVVQPAMKMAKGIQELTERGPPPPVACHICSDEFEEAYNHEANVFHGKLQCAHPCSCMFIP